MRSDICTTLTPSAEQFNRSREICEKLIAKDSQTIKSFIPTISGVLFLLDARNNPVLKDACRTTPLEVLSLFYETGLISERLLSMQIKNVHAWVRRVAFNELYNLLRAKGKNAFLRSIKSLDEPLCADGDTTYGDVLEELAEEDNEISFECRFAEVTKRMTAIKIDPRFKVIFDGLAEGKKKENILPDFRNAVLSATEGKGYDSEDKYSHNYDTWKSRGSELLNKQINYKQLVVDIQ